MEQSWDHFHPVFNPPRAMAPSGAGHFRLDDWDDPAVAQAALALHRQFGFGAVVANYVWFSGVLEAFDDDVIKVLDTHDVFGDRDLRMREAGLAPDWFFTTRAEEARGLARADIVLAIQEQEAAEFRALGHKDVRVIGHPLARRFRHRRAREDGRPVIGYLASGNPHNVGAFVALQEQFRGRPARTDRRFVLAGTICRQLPSAVPPFEVLGSLDHTDPFYDRVDVVLNPMATGTGLKIKSVEALFQGVPLVATGNAMIGLPSLHPLHALKGAADVADWALDSALDDGELAGLAEASRAAAAAYAKGVRDAAAGLVRSLAEANVGDSRSRSSRAKMAGSSSR